MLRFPQVEASAHGIDVETTHQVFNKGEYVMPEDFPIKRVERTAPHGIATGNAKHGPDYRLCKGLFQEARQ